MSGIEILVVHFMILIAIYLLYKKVIQLYDLEWHDFENNPDDKPKEEGTYLCCITNVDHDKDYMFYGILEFYNGHFVLNTSDSIFDSTDSWDDIVIGWAKIKKFEGNRGGNNYE